MTLTYTAIAEVIVGTNNTIQEKENIANLTQLWKVMGFSTRQLAHNKQYHYSLQWPNRLWFDWDIQEDNIEALINFSLNSSRPFSIPLWPTNRTDIVRSEKMLLDAGYSVLMRQCAMRKSLRSDVNYTENNTIHVVPVSLAEQATLWAHCISNSFRYVVDDQVVHHLVTLTQLSLYLIYNSQDKLMGATLLFENGDTIGLHYLGVLPEYRKKMVAYHALQKFFNICRSKDYTHLDLQSSPAGLNLYTRLGFQPLFFYNNYIFRKRQP